MKNFTEYADEIKESDLVLLFFNPRQIYPIHVKPNETFHHSTGAYHHNNIISQRYGSKLKSHTGRGSLYLMHPTCERWTMALPHRTQIVYTTDISVISSMLEIKAGSRVVESGTGSASFTHALARAVAPTGHVYTFEYHALRAETAKKEFKDHGIDNYVTITEANVYERGFSRLADQSSIIDGTIDAIFLDLPEPWRAIKHTPQLYHPERVGRICCFSPCIEQVQKTREALVESGFTQITMMECLQKQWEVRKVQNPSIGDQVERKRVLRDHKSSTSLSAEDSEIKTITSIPVCNDNSKGHTAYLTFATYLPISINHY